MIRQLTVVLLVLLAGCSLEYDMVDESADDGRPEIELRNLSHTVVRSNRIQLRVFSAYSRTYQSQNRQVLNDVYFWEYGTDGEIASEGRSDSAEVFLETEDIVFEGNIQLYSHVEEAGVNADFLEWSGEERQLQGRDGELVEIERDDGSVIRGSGFLADMRRRSIVFTQNIEGTFIDRDTENETTE